MSDNKLTEAQLLFRLQQFHGAELEATEMGDHEFAHECADVASIIREVQAYRKAADEPAAYQYRTFDPEYDEWGEWEDCGECAFEQFSAEALIPDSGVQTRKLYTAQQPVTVVPDGYVMVPAKANIVMVRAGAKAAREYLEECGGNSPWVIYQAMVAAASLHEVAP
ncbi:hypothetical protein [Enterobacter ludwigii]|uniref:hypothetical protein n=1 Tax=Enterobacter ludwigii TaxID=299767 RepID=UPI0013D8D010|nr:hypothetical protein [Enterobacter ludwigii]